ncbi:MAG: hypothetical protein RL885_23015 [Planctomycetota bacterium]
MKLSQATLSAVTWKALWLLWPFAAVLLCWPEEETPRAFSQEHALLWSALGCLAIGCLAPPFNAGKSDFPGWTAAWLVLVPLFAAWRLSGDRYEIVLTGAGALLASKGLSRWLARSGRDPVFYVAIVFAISSIPPWTHYSLTELGGVTGASWLLCLSPFSLMMELHGQESLEGTVLWAVITWSALGLLAIVGAGWRRRVTSALILFTLAPSASAQEITGARLATGEWARDGELVWVTVDLRGGEVARDVELSIVSSPVRRAVRPLRLSSGEERRVHVPVAVWRELPWLEVSLESGEPERIELRFVEDDRPLGAVLKTATSPPEPEELAPMYDRDRLVRIRQQDLPSDRPWYETFDYIVADTFTEALSELAASGGTLVLLDEASPRSVGSGRVLTLDDLLTLPQAALRRVDPPVSGDLLRVARPARWGFEDRGLMILLIVLVGGICTLGLRRRGRWLVPLLGVAGILALEMMIFHREPVSESVLERIDLKPGSSQSRVQRATLLSRRRAGEATLEVRGPVPPIRTPFRRERLPELAERTEWASDGLSGRIVAEVLGDGTAMWIQNELREWPGSVDWVNGELQQRLAPGVVWNDVTIVRDGEGEPRGSRERLAFGESWTLPLPAGESLSLESAARDELRRAVLRYAVVPWIRQEVFSARYEEMKQPSLAILAFEEMASPTGSHYQSTRSLGRIWLMRLR